MKPVQHCPVRRLSIIALLCAFALAQSSCAMWDRWWAARRAVQQLAWVETASPEQDVVAASFRQDTRFFAVRGSDDEIPGVSPEDEPLARGHGLRHIEGTGKALGSEHERLNKRARKYAAKYNKIMLAYVKKGAPRLP